VAESGRAHGWWQPENLDHSVGAGTLAAVLRSRDGHAALYGLTAGHVLAGDPAARFGNRVGLRCMGRTTAALSGRLHNWEPELSRDDPGTDIDAGLLTLDEASLALWVDEIDWPTGWAEAGVGSEVRLVTRHHHLPGRVVSPIDALMDVGASGRSYLLRDALCCEIEGGSQPGDSGAPVWDLRQRLVGLNVGAAPPGIGGNTVVMPIGRVLAWSGCELVLRGEALAGEWRGSAPPAAPPEPDLAQAQDTLARTMWAEARGEPDAAAGMGAVAHVVLNRSQAASWWGCSVQQVCLHPWQFSCWNAHDPNRPQLIAVTEANALFAQARRIAGELLGMTDAARTLADTTGRATHYHAASIAAPGWTRNAIFTRRIGNHLFYRGIA
jgi:hypothetical protein